MAGDQDALLTQLNNGVFDFQIDDDGDIKTDDSFDSAIVVSLFADRRALASQVLPPELRRGWIGDEFTPGFQIGSHLWLFDQSRHTQNVANDMGDAAQLAVDWFVKEELLESVRALGIRLDNGIELRIRFVRPNGKVENRFFTFWENTGKQ